MEFEKFKNGKNKIKPKPKGSGRLSNLSKAVLSIAALAGVSGAVVGRNAVIGNSDKTFAVGSVKPGPQSGKRDEIRQGIKKEIAGLPDKEKQFSLIKDGRGPTIVKIGKPSIEIAALSPRLIQLPVPVPVEVKRAGNSIPKQELPKIPNITSNPKVLVEKPVISNPVVSQLPYAPIKIEPLPEVRVDKSVINKPAASQVPRIPFEITPSPNVRVYKPVVTKGPKALQPESLPPKFPQARSEEMRQANIDVARANARFALKKEIQEYEKQRTQGGI